MKGSYLTILIIALGIKHSRPLKCSNNGFTAINTCFNQSFQHHHATEADKIVPLPEPVFATSNTLSPPPPPPPPSQPKPPSAPLTKDAPTSSDNTFDSNNDKFMQARHKLIHEVYANKTTLFKTIIKREISSAHKNSNGTKSNSTVVSDSNRSQESGDEVSTLNSIANLDQTNETLFELNLSGVESFENSSIKYKAGDELCDEHEDEHCFINHTEICVGDPSYCNLTYDEYMELLYEYIAPTTSEWILIVSHAVVFIMGLVSSWLT